MQRGLVGRARSVEGSDAAAVEELLGRARAGGTQALSQLLAQLAPMLRGYARQKMAPELRARMDESDVVQTALLEAARDFPKFEGTTLAELRAWLCGILRSNVLDDFKAHVLSRKRATGQESSLEELARSRGPIASDATSPSQQVARRERFAHLLRLASELPASQRQALELWLVGYGPEEIAARLHKSELAAASLIRRALGHLRARTASDGSGT